MYYRTLLDAPALDGDHAPRPPSLPVPIALSPTWCGPHRDPAAPTAAARQCFARACAGARDGDGGAPRAVLLHFGAVDWQMDAYVDGLWVGRGAPARDYHGRSLS